MNELDKQRKSPWKSLLTLVGIAFASAFTVQIVVLIVAILVFPGVSISNPASLQVDFVNQPTYSYVMIICSSFGTFLLPAWILKRIEPYFDYFPKGQKGQHILFVLAILFMVAFSPTMEWISKLNMGMSLPDSFKSIEVWMREKEDSMAMLTKNMVMVDRWDLLFINIFAIAVMPAIAEEYFFRGAMMKIFDRMFINRHVSIWVTAIIFSAIHVQFFGFVPRMLLGAFFGYMLLWTQNIWIPILAHFVNNASVVIIAFYFTREGKTFEELQSYGDSSIFMYIASFILSIVIGWYFYIKSKQTNIIDGKGLV